MLQWFSGEKKNTKTTTKELLPPSKYTNQTSSSLCFKQNINLPHFPHFLPDFFKLFNETLAMAVTLVSI